MTFRLYVQVTMSSERCSICLEDMTTSDEDTTCTLVPCNHRFHSNCIQNWLVCQETCPVCRVDTSQCQHGDLSKHHQDVHMSALRLQGSMIGSLRSEIRTLQDRLYVMETRNMHLSRTIRRGIVRCRAGVVTVDVPQNMNRPSIRMDIRLQQSEDGNISISLSRHQPQSRPVSSSKVMNVKRH